MTRSKCFESREEEHERHQLFVDLMERTSDVAWKRDSQRSNDFSCKAELQRILRRETREKAVVDKMFNSVFTSPPTASWLSGGGRSNVPKVGFLRQFRSGLVVTWREGGMVRQLFRNLLTPESLR